MDEKRRCTECKFYRDLRISSSRFACVRRVDAIDLYHDTEACEDEFVPLVKESEVEAVVGSRCEDCADVAICDAIRMTGQECRAFKPKAEEIGEPKKMRHFHSWDKKTGEYAGTVDACTGNEPVDKYYDYEEYEAPSHEVDGWYIVNFRSAENKIIREKRGEDIYETEGNKTEHPWSEYRVVARIPEIIWLDGRNN